MKYRKWNWPGFVVLFTVAFWVTVFLHYFLNWLLRPK
jgi:hypothetical protein